MRTRLIGLWDSIRSSFWFVPTLLALGAVAAAFGMVALDRAVKGSWIEAVGWTYTGGPEGARLLLSTVASSVITVAGVVFSITIAALTLASAQFGPRLLRNFIRDTGNQVVLGTFIATFLYCLLVLRTIRDVDDAKFVPHLSVTLGILLATLSLGVLIYFIHHIATSIQVSHVIAGVSRDLEDAIDELFPSKIGQEPGEREDERGAADIPPRFDRDASVVPSNNSGYLQGVDDARLMQIAVARNLLLRVVHRPGDFIVEGRPLACVLPPAHRDETLRDEINEAFLLGMQRTLTQDIEFAVNQLVEVAVRALSPSVNDPFTAMSCIDHLGAALAHLARKPFPSRLRYDEDGTLRVIAEPITYAGIVDAAFHPIRQYGRTSAPVTIRLLEILAVIAMDAFRAEDRATLLRHAALAERGSRDGLPEAADREDVRDRYRVVLRLLAEPNHEGAVEEPHGDGKAAV